MSFHPPAASSRRALLLPVLAFSAFSASANAQTLDSVTLTGFRWHTIGPSIFEGRVSDIAGIPSPSHTFFVAAAAGGIWKTTNDGITFRPVFEHEKVASMGSLAIAPSDTMQVWAGTGEQNTRNSIEPGGGVYKSTDGGITWKLMGLEKTQHIGRIVVHPTNPSIVYVAALGAAWKSNPERGLYKTTDGGVTWKLIKFVSDKAGFVDVALDPRNPEIVYASSYERVRGPWFLKSGGPGSALWKSTDGGNTWMEIKGGGFPETTKGRINIALAASNPDIIYATVEADSLPNPKPTKGAKAQKLKNGLYRSADAGKTWEYVSEQYNRPFYYNQVRVDPKDPNRVYFSSLFFSDDGGRHVRDAGEGVHVDHHAMWIDPNDPSHIVVGSDGGIYVTHDKGGNYSYGANLPIAQFYEVSYDYSIPYRVCAGAQDNGSWCGPSRRRSGDIQINDWFMIGGGDGFYTAMDPHDPDWIFSESQGGSISGRNLRTGDNVYVGRQSNWERRLFLEDSIYLLQKDSTRSPTSEEKQRIAGYEQQIKQDSINNKELRFNWNTPFLLSPHSSHVFYAGANRVLKSLHRGDSAYPISPDLSKQNKERIDVSTKTTGGVTADVTGAETYGTIVALAESPTRQGLLFAGTDDGNVWVTWNDGGYWEPIPEKRFPGLPNDEVYVSRIEPSHFDSLTCYITFDNHRTGDFTPYLYVTNDGGKTWRSIASTLPQGGPDFLHVIREDPHNRDLLFVGSSVGVYVSVDRGNTWHRFTSGLPTVPVYDLQIHPRDHDLIAATHGRGIWIVEITALEQMNTYALGEPVHLFKPRTTYQFPGEMRYGEAGYGTGQMKWSAPPVPYGANIEYRIATATKDSVRIVITDAAGDTLMSQAGQGTAGLHSVFWGMQGKSNYAPVVHPVMVRDSILAELRVKVVFDSLQKAGKMSKEHADRYAEAILNGDYASLYPQMRGAEGGGDMPSGPWNPRPAEGGWVGPKPDSLVKKDSIARAKADSAAKAAKAKGDSTSGAPPKEPLPPLFEGEFEHLSGVLDSIGGRGLRRTPMGLHTKRTMGYGGGGLVDTGDYLVTLTVGPRRQRQVLRVVRTTGEDSTHPTH